MVNGKYNKTIVKVSPEHDKHIQKWLSENYSHCDDFMVKARFNYGDDVCINMDGPMFSYKEYYKGGSFRYHKFMTSEDLLTKEGIINQELIW